MRTTTWWRMVGLMVWLVACTSTSPSDTTTDGGTSDAGGDGAVCGAGQMPAYVQGCGAPSFTCVTRSCGDAAAFPVCGCDGRTYSVCGTMLSAPDRPWAHAGACADGGA